MNLMEDRRLHTRNSENFTQIGKFRRESYAAKNTLFAPLQFRGVEGEKDGSPDTLKVEHVPHEAGESDQEIVFNSGMDRGKSTVWRFRNEKDLEALWSNGKLGLDPGPADKLWNYLWHKGCIERVLQKNGEFLQFRERVAANAISAFYAAQESETRAWQEKDGLQEAYFCCKPSFRKPGHIVKTRFEFTPRYGEFFEVKEHQDSRATTSGDAGEDSHGFAISKSGRLWIFLREVSKEQPRIFCFKRTDPSRDHLCRLYGYLMESDRKFGNDVYRWKVGLASEQIDKLLWCDQHNSGDYIWENQVDNIPYTERAKEKKAPNEDICLDEYIVDYIKSDVYDYERRSEALQD